MNFRICGKKMIFDKKKYENFFIITEENNQFPI